MHITAQQLSVVSTHVSILLPRRFSSHECNYISNKVGEIPGILYAAISQCDVHNPGSSLECSVSGGAPGPFLAARISAILESIPPQV
jgi:hypothetical protein